MLFSKQLWSSGLIEDNDCLDTAQRFEGSRGSRGGGPLETFSAAPEGWEGPQRTLDSNNINTRITTANHNKNDTSCSIILNLQQCINIF